MNSIVPSTAFCMAFLSFACAQKPENRTENVAADPVVTTVIKVETVRCNMCVDNITATLKETEGVTSASVDLDAKTATVKFVPAKIDLRSLEKAIADAGYDANGTKRNPEAYERLADCCK